MADTGNHLKASTHAHRDGNAHRPDVPLNEILLLRRTQRNEENRGDCTTDARQNPGEHFGLIQKTGRRTIHARHAEASVG